MSRSHSFSLDVAQQFNVDIALLLQHFCFWYLKNKADHVNYYKGDYWVRMKAKQLHEYFPYFTQRQLRYLVDKMIDKKLLKQDEFNDKKNDRTKWYSLTNSAKKIMNISTDKNVSNSKKSEENIPTETPQILSDKNVNNVTHKIVTPTDKNVTSIYKEVDIEYRYIYYKEKILSNESLLEVVAIQNKIKIVTVKNKIDEYVLWCKSQEGKRNHSDSELFQHFPAWMRKQNLKDVDLELELNWFIGVFNTISKSEFQITENIKKLFAVQFAGGFTGDQMVKAVTNLYSSSVKNKFHLQHGFKFATPEYLLKEDNLNKYLNIKF
ncbi:hypothetical protein OD91_0876 [Lutibacter sp. Hel_I_33_5]|uniref:hypothetical protein n=1 Tax=Lutibacter sp. Hel_I_33_5 TaxID=1566289 RepID=UPI0011A02B96|nr:hypothetical protein [Lutibacter sp. Hel_I_33_5]TVZ55621.1 hypothetical protein OD91_0876 [Lutibacter sp. Hel_I_33_5]